MSKYVRRGRRTPEQRFWSKVDKDGPVIREELGPCWDWVGGKDSHGYGGFSVSLESISAHRFSWILANGPITDGLFVCHKCDRRACVRPDHFFLGTQKDNLNDRDAKGRGTVGDKNGVARHPEVVRGERNGRALLNESDVLDILRMAASGHRPSDIAKLYPVKETAVYKIVHGKSWRHIQREGA